MRSTVHTLACARLGSTTKMLLPCLQGLVLHDVAYNDAGQRRPVMHRGSLVEMCVPCEIQLSLQASIFQQMMTQSCRGL